MREFLSKKFNKISEILNFKNILTVFVELPQIRTPGRPHRTLKHAPPWSLRVVGVLLEDQDVVVGVVLVLGRRAVLRGLRVLVLQRGVGGQRCVARVLAGAGHAGAQAAAQVRVQLALAPLAGLGPGPEKRLENG